MTKLERTTPGAIPTVKRCCICMLDTAQEGLRSDAMTVAREREKRPALPPIVCPSWALRRSLHRAAALVRSVMLLAAAATVSPTLPGAEPSLEDGFRDPPNEARPETWFHLIGGNVSRAGLTRDLEAIAAAGIGGIQLFHGSGREWPGISPQIQCLSPTWDTMIQHVANETQRLGLRFSMQNCPGWAMSGGPWITPDKAMRHLITSRTEIVGGKKVDLPLPRPQPSTQAWRDYRDIAVLAFPTPLGDHGGGRLQPVEVYASDPDAPWDDLLSGKSDAHVEIPPSREPEWVELVFFHPVTVRSIELPPIELLMKRRNFDPATRIVVKAWSDHGWKELSHHDVPRGTWQDRQPEFPYVLAIPDASSTRYRIVFENQHPMELTYLRLFSTARLQDWRGQAGYALRSREHMPTPTQAREAWIQAEDIIDLTDKMDEQGNLSWDAPGGNWTVLRFGHVNTGAKNKPAPPEATGFECDKLSSAGAEQHFAGYIGRLSAPGGPADGGRLQGMVIDSWECYTQTWTPAMERAFQERRGYTLRPWLPALAGYVVKDPETSERFLRDWRATISDLLVENYFGRLAELARERGMRLSFETAIGDVSPGDILEYQSRADVPMCEFWQPNDPHLGGIEAKPIWPTASAAHIYGKERVAAESFTNVGFDGHLSWSEHPFALKNFADRAFAQGVTHVVFHTYTHNPLDGVPGTSFGGRIGTPFIRGQTWWKYMPVFTDYLARCTLMLERGNPVADVLWYLGDDLDHKPRQDSPFPPGYRFDYLNADVLLNRLTVREGLLRIPEGTTWRVIWLPREQCRRLTPATLARLKELIEAGAIVIGEPPETNATLMGGAQADVRFAQLTNELWGQQPPPTGDRVIGRGRLLWGGGLEATLHALGIQPDLAGARSATWCHRQDGETDIYFIAADRLSPLRANLKFRALGKPEFWDPLTGTTTPIPVYQTHGDTTTITMDLPAAGSVFVVFQAQPAKPQFTSVDLNGTPWIDPNDPTRADTADPFPHFGLSPDEPLQPWIEPPVKVGQWRDDGHRFVAWRDGTFRFGRLDKLPLSVPVHGTRALSLKDWTLSFPAGWDTPASIQLERPGPWSELKDTAVRMFSGTAIYRTSFVLEPPASDERICLDLGRVENIAAIRINGHHSGTLWTPPFRLDITEQVLTGENTIEIGVTNTWRNRLAYEQSLPEAKRKTWTYAAPEASEDPIPGGLIGPVRLNIGKEFTLPDD